MNGIHDMGGMQDMGTVVAEKNEPVFHESWEGRLFALRRAMAAWGKWNIDVTRHEVELVPPEEYLRLSYYARQFVAFLPMIVKSGLVLQAEIDSGTPSAGQPKATPVLTREKALTLIAKGIPASRDVKATPRFKVGQRVRARNINPIGHTRLPRYARGKTGTVQTDHGIFVLPDTNAHFKGENPQHLYSVRFTARELWGESASAKDSVNLDMWDDYLDPA
jgi:nitrile hydratase subunit beta